MAVAIVSTFIDSLFLYFCLTDSCLEGSLDILLEL